MTSSAFTSLFVLSIGALAACNEPEEEKVDPRVILDACNLPEPCGAVSLPAPPRPLETIHLPLEANACIHDALSGPAHLFGSWQDAWIGVVHWDLYSAGPGKAVLINAIGSDADVDYVEHCRLKTVDFFECANCSIYDCAGAGLEPSDLVCGGPEAWCSELVDTEPACP